MLAWSGVFFFTALFVASIVILLLIERQRTKSMLERCGLPTVLWTPRFMCYRPFEEDQKLASTSITRILPRMQTLQGPYGMYGTVYGINVPVVHVAHPVPAKAVLCGTVSSTAPGTRPRSIGNSTGASKAPAYDHFKNFCGDGVFTADGDDWKAKRTVVIHTLLKGPELYERLQHEANHAADEFCREVESLRRIQSSDRAKEDANVLVPNIIPLLQRATLGLIYRYITHDNFGWKLCRACKASTLNTNIEDEMDCSECSPMASSTEDDGNIPEEEMARSESMLQSYMTSIVRIRMIILAQSRSIWFLLPRWCYRNFSSLYRDEESTLSPIREFARQACKRAKAQSPLHNLSLSEGPYCVPCDPSVARSRSSTCIQANKNLVDEAITLLFAGQDTSAATLSWTLHLLSLYPDIQEKLVMEVQTVFKQQCNEIEGRLLGVTKKSIDRMPFLDAVIKESMRLYPVAPFVVRRVVDTIVLPGDGASCSSVSIPSKSVACIWIYALHRNPDFWNRPNEFVPDRWLEDTGLKKDTGQTNGSYMPFASGPRNCLGQPLAHVILRTLLSKLVYRYQFIEPRLICSGCDSIKLEKDMQAGFTVLPSGGVEMVVKTRGQKVKFS